MKNALADPVRRRALLALIPLALAACSALPTTPTDAPPERPSRGPAHWRLTGRLSINRGEERHHVTIDWRHETQADEIQIASPLGQTLARLWRDERQARLETKGETLIAADWRELAARVLGEALPLSDLARWLTGDLPNASLDELDRPRAAEVEGWQIEILRYDAASRDAWPALIDLRRDDFRLRLKIDQWTPLEAPP